jgi:FkbM family methyltransferase
METDCVVAGDAIAIRHGGFWQTVPRQLERRIRSIFSAPSDLRASLATSIPDAQTLLDRVTVETPNGARQLYCRKGTSDEGVVWSIFGRRDYDLSRLRRFAKIREWIEARHREGRRALIIDAGANIGASAVFFALTFPTALVIAIEPEPGNFALLVKNAQGLNIRCLQAALASADGQAEIRDPGEGNWGFRAEPTQSTGGGIPCVTIDSLYRETCNDTVFPFIVKVDIEGGEEEVFAHNTEWVARTPVLVAELHDWLLPKGRTSLPFLRCVSALDRDFVYLGEDVFSIANTLP